MTPPLWLPPWSEPQPWPPSQLWLHDHHNHDHRPLLQPLSTCPLPPNHHCKYHPNQSPTMDHYHHHLQGRSPYGRNSPYAKQALSPYKENSSTRWLEHWYAHEKQNKVRPIGEEGYGHFGTCHWFLEWSGLARVVLPGFRSQYACNCSLWCGVPV